MPINKKLQQQLIAMGKKDQKMRASNKWDEKIDFENTRRLKSIIEQFGWPDISIVNKEASHLAWLIAQHADHDITFQEECLHLLKKKRKTIDPIEIAYLSDRINVNKGIKQLYGTQFYLDADKKLVPRPIYDLKNLDKRRIKAGLEKFENYNKRLINRQKNI